MDILGIVTIPNWLLLLLLILVIVYSYSTWQYNVWAERRIPYAKPWPFLGTFYVAATHGLHRGDYQLVKKYGKFFGAFEGRNPVLMVSDPDVIREITVKHAMTHFPDRAYHFNVVFDDFTSQGVTVKSGEDWKASRSVLTPTFTGNKMKRMFEIVKQSANPLMKHLEELAEKKEQFEVKQLFGTFTLDVIASTMFGIEIDSQNNPNSEFVKYASKAFSGANIKNPVFMAAVFFPILVPLCKRLGYSFFPSDVLRFFRNVSTDVIQLRRQGRVSRTDFIQLMINAHRESKESKDAPDSDDQPEHVHHKPHQGLSDVEILANAVIFFVAGYETTATAISWFSYILATKPDIQEAVLREIDAVVGGGEVNYDTLQRLEYVDRVWAETLRMYPPAERFDRTCSADCELSNGHTIRAGDELVIPIYTVHMDPDNFPDPETFNPDRFTSAGKASRSPYSYLPFGSGPRNCIGMRFAVMVAKFALVTMLQRFRVVRTPGIIDNLSPLHHKFLDSGITYVPHGIHLKVEKRDRQ